MRWRRARPALSELAVAFCSVMSIARNMSERKVGKSRSRRVGRCLGLIEMAPVAGSITML